MGGIIIIVIIMLFIEERARREDTISVCGTFVIVTAAVPLTAGPGISRG